MYILVWMSDDKTGLRLLPHANAEAHKRFMAEVETWTSEQFMGSLVRAGIFTADGELTEGYRPEPKSIDPDAVTLAGSQAMLKEVVEEKRGGLSLPNHTSFHQTESRDQFFGTKSIDDVSAQDRLAVKALVDALPRCESSDVDFGGMSDCQQPASGHNEDCGAHFRLCDKHSADGPDFNPLPYAAPLRALLDRMKGWHLPTEKCGCYGCASPHDRIMKMIVCSDCGHKRCPKSTSHKHACTGSNEPMQAGSRY